MHISLLTPYYNQPRGNSTTAKRLAHYLNKQNILTSVFPYLEIDVPENPSGDIFHILHATHFLEWAKNNHFEINRPYIVTMGGTDINIDLQESMDKDMFLFLDVAKYITVFTKDAKEKVETLFSGWADKTFVIPQGIWAP